MDKLLIAIGIAMLWAAITDTQTVILNRTALMTKEPGFVGIMATFGVLLTIASYKQYASAAAALGFIIAFGIAKNQSETAK